MGFTFNADKPRDHLVLPDRQAKPGTSNRVDEAVGNYIKEHTPDVIVDLGDHADMESLCIYDKGQKGFEGRRYKDDIAASIRANEIQFAAIDDINATRARGKRKRYKPLRVITIGNHEHRIPRAVESDAVLEGVISIDDLQFERFFDVVAPFLTPVVIDGVCYVHYAYRTNPRYPIGGKHVARTILDEYKMSTTVGHSPIFDYAECHTGADVRLQGIVAGARFEHFEDYASARNRRYWRGIIHKKNVQGGRYDYERISLKRLLKEYL